MLNFGQYKEKPKPPVMVVAAQVPDYIESILLATKDGSTVTIAAGDWLVLDSTAGRIVGLTNPQFVEQYDPA